MVLVLSSLPVYLYFLGGKRLENAAGEKWCCDTEMSAAAGGMGDPRAVQSLFDQLWQQHGAPRAMQPPQHDPGAHPCMLYLAMEIPVPKVC